MIHFLLIHTFHIATYILYENQSKNPILTTLHYMFVNAMMHLHGCILVHREEISKDMIRSHENHILCIIFCILFVTRPRCIGDQNTNNILQKYTIPFLVMTTPPVYYLVRSVHATLAFISYIVGMTMTITATSAVW